MVPTVTGLTLEGTVTASQLKRPPILLQHLTPENCGEVLPAIRRSRSSLNVHTEVLLMCY